MFYVKYTLVQHKDDKAVQTHSRPIIYAYPHPFYIKSHAHTHILPINDSWVSIGNTWNDNRLFQSYRNILNFIVHYWWH